MRDTILFIETSSPWAPTRPSSPLKPDDSRHASRPSPYRSRFGGQESPSVRYSSAGILASSNKISANTRNERSYGFPKIRITRLRFGPDSGGERYFGWLAFGGPLEEGDWRNELCPPSEGLAEDFQSVGNR